MGITITFAARDASLPPVAAALLARDLCRGRLTRWKARLRQTDLDPILARLADLLDAGDVTVLPAVAGIGELTAPARLTRFRPSRKHPDVFKLRAEAIDFDAPTREVRPDRRARRRVHHPRNAAELLRRLSHVAVMPPAVANTLARLTFPAGEKTSLPQGGADDLSFLRRVLAGIDALQTDAALRGLALSGRAGDGRPPGWQITWPHAAAFVKVNGVEARTLRLGADDGAEHVVFGSRGSRANGRERVGRTPSAAAWKAWAGRDLPLFTDGKRRRVVRLRDRFYETGAGRVGWDSRWDVLPDDADLSPVEPTLPPAPWLGSGVVEAWQDGWLRVRLPGFEADAEGDRLHARLITPYAGLHGDRGLHLVPEQGTEVLLAWPGGLADPVLVLGNIRTRGVQLSAPSLWLELPAVFHFDELTVEIDGKGDVRAGRDLSVQTPAKLHLRGTDLLELIGGGATARLIDAAFKTGRGG
jgi:hypothetical protein